MSLAEVAVKYGFTTQQDVDCNRDGWSSFPVSRPMKNTKVKVLIDGVEKDGISYLTSGTCSTGMALKVGDDSYDSNHKLWWKAA
jgi:hypothetical protein